MSVLPSNESKSTPTTEPSVELDIEARTRDLGDGFTVRRLLPSAARRMVGPFIFLDHMGPVQLAPRHGLDVRPHPHINLATMTYLFDGEILHRDSLGSEQPIRPGAVNWMTAGRGIVHSERSPAVARKTGARVHGLQLWVALPKTAEEVEPTFLHHGAGDIPAVERMGARLGVVAGSAYGASSPVQVLSQLFFVEAKLDRAAELRLPDGFAGRAAYVVEGSIACDGHTPMGRARCSSSAQESRRPSPPSSRRG
jgi:redox-sensitive bicupin YhaK (pirin superfamily)